MAKDGIRVDVYGDKELRRFMNQLPLSFDKKLMRATFTEATKGAIKSIRADTNEVTGNLKRSIGFKLVRGSGPLVWSGFIGARMSRRNGKYGRGHHAHLYAFGRKKRGAYSGKGDWIYRNAAQHEAFMERVLTVRSDARVNKVVQRHNRSTGTGFRIL